MGNTDTPVVSICCITYNHEKYIRDAIEGFLIQKTSFPIEIIIHDDASTDGTVKIIKEYEDKHPELFNCVFQKENQYSKGVRGIAAKFTFPIAKGKYIALCEGDDYWTDPYKLQKQVDYLESNPDCSMCFHNAYLLNQERGERIIKYTGQNKNTYTIEDILQANFTTTASVMFRRIYCMDLVDMVRTVHSMDHFIFIHIAQFGKIGYIDNIMSVYRLHGSGVHTSLSKIDKYINKIKTCDEIDKHLKCKYHKTIRKIKSKIYYSLSNMEFQEGHYCKYNIYLLKGFVLDPFGKSMRFLLGSLFYSVLPFIKRKEI